MGACTSNTAPAPICRAAESGAAVLQLLDKSPDTRDRLTWRWKRGEETLPPALGDPTVATAYALCAYDASANPQPRLRAALPPGARWGSAGSGFRYRDPSAAAAGIESVRLVPGPNRIGARHRPRARYGAAVSAVPADAAGGHAAAER